MTERPTGHGEPFSGHSGAPRPSRAALVLALGLLAVAGVVASHHTWDESDPVIADNVLEVQAHSRMFYSIGELDAMAEFIGRFEGESRDSVYRGITLGGYYRIHRNLKAGAFYRLQFGARHDDDWIEQDSAWLWTDASSRAEHLVILDATPRFLLGFLPGRNWVFSVKNRYEYNFSNSQQTLLVRPGLTWFWVRDREPVLNLSAQYGTYLSLNFGDLPWYRHGPYINLLYHALPNLQLDIGASRQWVYWSESEQFATDWPAASYEENLYSPWSVDVGMILKLN